MKKGKKTTKPKLQMQKRDIPIEFKDIAEFCKNTGELYFEWEDKDGTKYRHEFKDKPIQSKQQVLL